jgi:hypothetical protein
MRDRRKASVVLDGATVRIMGLLLCYSPNFPALFSRNLAKCSRGRSLNKARLLGELEDRGGAGVTRVEVVYVDKAIIAVDNRRVPNESAVHAALSSTAINSYRVQTETGQGSRRGGCASNEAPASLAAIRWRKYRSFSAGLCLYVYRRGEATPPGVAGGAARALFARSIPLQVAELTFQANEAKLLGHRIFQSDSGLHMTGYRNRTQPVGNGGNQRDSSEPFAKDHRNPSYTQRSTLFHTFTPQSRTSSLLTGGL